MDQQDVVERLRRKQAELGIETQTELAEMLDVSRAMICRLYSGKRKPGAAVIMGMLKLWPDIFNGGNRERHSEGDEHRGGADDGSDRDLDAAGDPGDPCPAQVA